jgi:hypothetical protein
LSLLRPERGFSRLGGLLGFFDNFGPVKFSVVQSGGDAESANRDRKPECPVEVCGDGDASYDDLSHGRGQSQLFRTGPRNLQLSIFFSTTQVLEEIDNSISLQFRKEFRKKEKSRGSRSRSWLLLLMKENGEVALLATD